MKPLKLLLIAILVVAGSSAAQESEGELTKIKERELEDVRARISELKKSMDSSASTRDQLTAELQDAEVEISETRIRLKELERQRDFSAKRKAELDEKLAMREAELDA